jgi:hypothetical protein
MIPISRIITTALNGCNLRKYPVYPRNLPVECELEYYSTNKGRTNLDSLCTHSSITHIPIGINSAMVLSHIEVMQILEGNEGNRRQNHFEATEGRTTLRQRDWIEENFLEYLKLTQCVQAATDKMPHPVKRLRARPKNRFAGLQNRDRILRSIRSCR